MFVVGKRERAMLRLALDQFIQRTTWCDHETQREWIELLDELRYHRPGTELQLCAELMTDTTLEQMRIEIIAEQQKRDNDPDYAEKQRKLLEGMRG